MNHRKLRSWLRRSARSVLLAVLAATVVAAGPGAASADIGRPNQAETEIENYYREFLGRPSDPGGFTGYRDRMWADCKFGVLSAGMMIGDSAEAHNRWRTPNAFVPAMYRALLNRNADSGGMQTYVNVINARGYRWAIRDIQASAEFRTRLNAMCQGRRGSLTQNELKPEEAESAALGIAQAGTDLLKACGVGAGLTLLEVAVTKRVYAAPKAIKAAKIALSAKVANGTTDACKSAYKVTLTAWEIDQAVNYVPGYDNPGYNNPAYAYINQWSGWEWNGRWCHVQLGAGRSAPERSWREVKFRC
ncbi:DUF4214 domain-containing protein [Streptomyces sp. NPDC021080]|uniref:DUF4214 domain-containing protein n=1 Tax=Streptomyces sp. NPDC021080 TaxID=3365110 RepID=UPI0037B010AB